MRHEVARTVVCYGHIVNKPAVPSAESIGASMTGNGRVGSCRDNAPHSSDLRIERYMFIPASLTDEQDASRLTPGSDALPHANVLEHQSLELANAAREAGFDGANRHLEDFSDFLVGIILQIK